MRNSPKQFAEYQRTQGILPPPDFSITPACWPHLSSMKPTELPPPSGDVSDESLLRTIDQYEAEASRLLARAADLRAIVAKRAESA